MQNIEINIHGFRFIEIETGYVAKPNRTAINRVPLSALVKMEVELNLHIYVLLYGLLGQGKHEVVLLIGSFDRNESELNIVI